MEGRMRAGAMSFNDFLKQVQVMQKMGSLQSMMSKVPGMQETLSDEQLKDGEQARRYAKCRGDMRTSAPPAFIDERRSCARRRRRRDGGMSAIADKSGASPRTPALRQRVQLLSKAAQGFARGEDPRRSASECRRSRWRPAPAPSTVRSAAR